MPDAPQTRSLARFSALIAALRDGPLDRPTLLTRLGNAYPHSASARPMIDRDVKQLGKLGIVIAISRTRPPIYMLRGGTPALSDADLHALALIRHTFGSQHPQFTAISVLLDTLTSGLDAVQQAEYARRQTSRAPLQPAIDYTVHAATIARLELAISRREIISFRYTNTRGTTSEHQTEAYEIEYYERHFYLVAYSLATHQILDYRVDRVTDIRTVQTLPAHLSRTHARPAITFRYRLAATLARGEISQRFDSQRIIERMPNGDAIIEAIGHSDFFIVRTMLKYAGNAELLWPDWLRAQMAAEVGRVAALYTHDSRILIGKFVGRFLSFAPHLARKTAAEMGVAAHF
jgi:predicted DNA-binding transcriptional regulator YafY